MRGTYLLFEIEPPPAGELPTILSDNEIEFVKLKQRKRYIQSMIHRKENLKESLEISPPEPSALTTQKGAARGESHDPYSLAC